jgi:arylsulfatase A-like enzyme
VTLRSLAALRSTRVLVWVALLGSAACARSRPRAADGDVVLIVVDTLRADHLSLHGYGRATSPALDALAREAVVYEHATSPGTWTVPSHAALFTGRWPSFAGAERVPAARNLALPINPDLPTLAGILGERGLHTAAFVANSTYVARVLGFARGFAEFFDHKLGGADGVRTAFVDWLKGRRDRVFVFMNILDPHEPYDPPEPYRSMFPGRDEQWGTVFTSLVNAGTPITPKMRAHFVSQYDGEIAYTDHVLGAIFDDLRRAGRWDAALVIVTSDHGELLGEHGLAGHGLAPYEELLHVPLLVKYPGGVRAGERVTRRVSTLGVFATVLASVGVQPPPATDSRPLDEEHPVWAEDIDSRGRRVRVGYEGSSKVVLFSTPGGAQTELFDLASDPAEVRPLRDGTAAPRLRAALATFDAAERPVNRATAPVIDPEREERLRELGYIQ